jgi:hypothetical protein
VNRPELVQAVKKHFERQKIKEADVIARFLYAVQNMGLCYSSSEDSQDANRCVSESRPSPQTSSRGIRVRHYVFAVSLLYLCIEKERGRNNLY